ncbi:hypothetical protein [Streptomyces sp. NPDC048172]|uniref:hypothetical protein n=1 Tax=Streptomyces sp. NPDC048172 TaxID=3365505 RepID=UPI00371099C4
MSGERLAADWMRDWCARTDQELAALMTSFEARYGFPPGTHAVVRASDESHRSTDALVELTPVPSDLTTMYWVLAEVSLPDVHTGTFVHPAATVARHFQEYGDIRIEGEEPGLVFASDGGGHLFALAGSGRVWRSAAASWSARFDLAAAGLQEFFEGLTRQIGDQL